MQKGGRKSYIEFNIIMNINSEEKKCVDPVTFAT